MPREKIVYVSQRTHRRLKVLAAQRNRSMGQLIDDLVAGELEGNLWTGPGGLWLQQRALAEAWDDPALDVYNDA